MTKSFQTLLAAAAVVALTAPAQAHDSTRHNDGRYTDHTHTERNMMDAGPRTAGRYGLYKSNNDDGYNNYEGYYVDNYNRTHVYMDDDAYVATGSDAHVVYTNRGKYVIRDGENYYKDGVRKYYLRDGVKYYVVDTPSYRHTTHVKTTANTAPWQNLTNEQVAYVQNKLDNRGYNIAVDGKLGPQTRAALRTYQRNNNLSVTGQVNEQTLASLGIATKNSVRVR